MLGTLKVYVSSKSNCVGSWMKNPSRIAQNKDTASYLDHPWAVNFWKLEWERYLPTSSFSNSALPFWFWPLMETVLGWVGIWFGHPGCCEVLTTVCSKVFEGNCFSVGSSFLGWFVCLFVFYFGFATGMASEMFSLLCVGCIKGDGTSLDSIVTQCDRYAPSSFHSILLSHVGISERF